MLEDYKKGLAEVEKDVFIGSAINPSSAAYRRWMNLICLLAAYHYVLVPVRICFRPWHSFMDPHALAADVPADMLTVAHVVVLANTAYKTRNGR